MFAWQLLQSFSLVVSVFSIQSWLVVLLKQSELTKAQIFFLISFIKPRRKKKEQETLASKKFYAMDKSDKIQKKKWILSAQDQLHKISKTRQSTLMKRSEGNIAGSIFVNDWEFMIITNILKTINLWE